MQGTPERLMLQLIEENSMTDPTYVEDFLLTHRTFVTSSQNVMRQLLQWFEIESTAPLQTSATSAQIRDRVTRVILLWVNNHFIDFESDPHMMKFLETFENGLESKNMHEQLHLLHIACAAKARTRIITLARSSRDEDLHFKIVGGHQKGPKSQKIQSIFISSVDKQTKAEDVGLKRGDQILEVNGNNFERNVTHERALELMTGTTHLCITVKSNLLAFKELLQGPDNNSQTKPKVSLRTMPTSELSRIHSQNNQRLRLSSVDLPIPIDQPDCAAISSNIDSTNSVSSIFSSSITKKNSVTPTNSISSMSSNVSAPPNSASKSGGGFMTLGPKRRIQKALIKMNLISKNTGASLLSDTDDLEGHSTNNLPTSTISSNGPGNIDIH